ncbi:hypothetical protein K456DRAFT_448390 [Colletotrichum gloeosporioides 23]|nr:hypothetical protein K456DRAFT_448390 [Colletotrichum gloeosporioides 23]
MEYGIRKTETVRHGNFGRGAGDRVWWDMGGPHKKNITHIAMEYISFGGKGWDVVYLLAFSILLILLYKFIPGELCGLGWGEGGCDGRDGGGMDECTNVWIHVNSLVNIDDFELTWVAMSTSSHIVLQNLTLFVMLGASLVFGCVITPVLLILSICEPIGNAVVLAQKTWVVSNKEGL